MAFPHGKTEKRFLANMFFGMQAAKSVVLSRVARELREDILLKKTEERLSRHPGTELRLVVVRWPRGERPMMLLTTVRAARSRRSLRQVVEGYLTRWRVEETIRFGKQSYDLEDMRLLGYGRLRALVAVVAAVAYFAMA